MQIWRMRAGADRRFKSGHPWVYSNELVESPKGINPGASVELQDASGRVLARGYGNPHSLIAFRALSRDPQISDPMEPKAVVQTLLRAGRMRQQAGLMEVSHRLVFGEADRLPGLVIDRFRLAKQGQVFVVQAHSAGADRIAANILEILEGYLAGISRECTIMPSWKETAVVLRNDLGVRKLEGLQEEPPRILKELGGLDLKRARILVAPADRAFIVGLNAGASLDSVGFETDLLEGQKTGFFLDQAANIELATLRFANLRPADGKKIRILDLCCYVGQWSTQLARAYRRRGWEVEVLFVDASAQALELAKKNAEAQGAHCETLKGDVLKCLDSLAPESFDLVISDPPALIKGRKDIPAGTHAYLQLNTQVFRVIRRGGAIVSCSCSALLEEEEFLRALSKASFRNGRSVRWVGRGAQAVDHPILIEFPEGRYLKSWQGWVDTVH